MLRLGPCACALLILCLLPLAAQASDLLHAARPVVACSVAAAMHAAAAPAAHRHQVRHVSPHGPCFDVEPGEAWERLGTREGLLLLRRVPPRAGEPPLFFQPLDMIAPNSIVSGPTLPIPTRVEGIVMTLSILSVAALVVPSAARRDRFAKARRLVFAEIGRQRAALRVRRLQLLDHDAYGTVRRGKWDKERTYFCDTRLKPLLERAGLSASWPRLEAAALHRIEQASADETAVPLGNRRQGSDPRVFDPDMTPGDYERHCAILLNATGWKARVTPASGDQGVDVIAEKGRDTLILQCKLYSRPVGNDAVQAIAAARSHYAASHAAVVSNQGYTSAARQLARTNGILLLHHEELASLPRLMSPRRASA